MVRKLSYHSAALNIAASPHTSPNTYTDLFNKAFSLHQPIKLRGDRKAIMAILDSTSAGEGTITGTIVTFIDISTEDTWFDLARNEEASETALQEIHIPENLKAKSKTFHFFFDISHHILIFEQWYRANSISPNKMQEFFQALFEDPRITSMGVEVAVTIIQSIESIEKILQIPFLAQLEIDIKLPNTLSDIERSLFSEMEGEHAKRMNIKLEHRRNESLTPNEERKRQMKVGRKNGRVIGKGKDINNNSIEISTEDHPQIEGGKIDSGESILSALMNIAARFLRG